MEGFCGGNFWDNNVTWNTDVPDFTTCFQDTALIWGPCAFLWIFSPLEIYFQSHSIQKSNAWNLLTITRMFIATCLTGVSLADMIRAVLIYLDGGDVYPSSYYGSFVKSLSYILCIILIHTGRKRGIRTSGVLFIFFLLLTLSEVIIFRSFLLQIYNNEVAYQADKDEVSFILISVTLPLVFCELILFCFADHKSTLQQPGLNIEKISPEETSSFLSHLSFWWFNDLAIKGYKNPLHMDDMWTLSDANKSKVIVSQFDKYYNPMMEKSMKLKASMAPSTEAFDSSSNKPTAGILTPIIKAFGLPFLTAVVIKFVASLLTFASPLILDELIAFVSGNDAYWKGFFYAGLLFFSAMIESILNNQHEYIVYCVGLRMKSAMVSAIYRKAIVLSSSARRNYTVGEIVNLMSVDIQRLVDFMPLVNILWSAPLQIGVALYLLWQQIGVSTLAGLGFMILLVPVNGYITVKLKTLQVFLMKAKDKRTKLMNEILGGIKVLKLYGWEESFEKKAMDFRQGEVKSLTTQAYYSAVITFFFTTAPFFVSLASFAVFVLISPNNILDANKAFVSLSLFNILKMPFAFLPMVITFAAMFLVSLTRLNNFLSCDELDPNAITRDSSTGDTPLSVKNASFTWSSDEEPLLKDLNLNVEKGSLVAIVGTVGSGKSSLLSAILGDMLKLSGQVNIKGRIAYVPQQAWIQNATLRNNILFLKKINERWYNSVIEKCCLKPDFDILPGGDQTEIGEKGINLSGGQKQRVSLARAVYSDSDVYLLDDPLSAVDAHVSKDIFDNVISHSGVLKGKTRILVTHRITVLPECDSIIVLKDGKISEEGSYNELLARKGAFAEFLVQHLTQQGADAVDSVTPNELQVMEQIAAHVGSAELFRQISIRSGGESDGGVFSDSAHGRTRTMSNRQMSVTESLRRRTSTVTSMQGGKGSSKEDLRKIVDQTKLIDAETSEEGSVKMDVYFKYFKACGWQSTIWVILAFAFAHGFNIGSSIWLSEWSNDSLDPNNMYDTKLRDTRLGVYSALGGGEAIFIMMGSLILSLCTLTGAKILHDDSLTHILKAPMSFFDTTPMGRILNRFTKDIDSIDNVIRFNLRMWLVTVFRAIVAIILISLQTWYFILVMIPLAVVYYLVQLFYIASSRQLKRLESVTRSPIYTHFSETVSGSTSIRAFGATGDFIEESNNRVDYNHCSYFPSIASNRWLAIRLEFLGYTISFLAALFAVLSRETLSPGIAGLAISYSLTMTATLNMLVRASADIETNIVCVERCLEYTTTPIEAPRRVESSKPGPEWPHEGNIQFEDYSVRYRDGLDLVLKKINCNIRPKEKVGIVGRTGAGKSSLTLCLFRLIESVTGRIMIDGIDISKLGLYDLRSKLTIIPQDPVLFTGTLRLNLDPFDTHTDDELWAALEHAHLKAYVTSTEKCLLHDISEGGENLSVGQRQLLCLARALLRKTKVLIMDEATAAVDMETDELIQTTIRKEFEECTVLTIAHRLNTIMDYDRVIVLDKGEVAEFDSPENLLKDSNSIFYGMAKDADLV